MATVFKKKYTKPIPDGAKRYTRNGEEYVRWKDRTGKKITGKMTAAQDGSARVLIESRTYTAKYRDGSGTLREVSTGCRQEDAARQILANLVRRSEHVRSGILTTAQDAAIDHQSIALKRHFDAYINYLKSKDATPEHCTTTRAYLDKVAQNCSFNKLAELNRSSVEQWLAAQAGEDMSARSRNAYRGALIAFCNWCVSTSRIVANPLAGMPKANEKADQRRRRRSMTEEELASLLDMARKRPLLDAQTVRRGSRKGLLAARLKTATEARLSEVGKERALIYKTLVLTGLRRSELASLTFGQLELEEPRPYAVLHAADEKNRQGSTIPLREDLAADLKQWKADRLTAVQNAARAAGATVPMTLPAATLLFRVPKAMVKIMNRDLAAAGIAKRDGRGWTLDVHALRTTFGTLLSRGGVPLRTAQAAMRHSDPSLTANVYTDPKLLDVAGALDALPALPLDASSRPKRERMTGTDDARQHAPKHAPASVKPATNESTADKTAE